VFCEPLRVLACALRLPVGSSAGAYPAYPASHNLDRGVLQQNTYRAILPGRLPTPST
jgi:hypothetical protein